MCLCAFRPASADGRGAAAEAAKNLRCFDTCNRRMINGLERLSGVAERSTARTDSTRLRVDVLLSPSECRVLRWTHRGRLNGRSRAAASPKASSRTLVQPLRDQCRDSAVACHRLQPQYRTRPPDDGGLAPRLGWLRTLGRLGSDPPSPDRPPNSPRPVSSPRLVLPGPLLLRLAARRFERTPLPPPVLPPLLAAEPK